MSASVTTPLLRAARDAPLVRLGRVLRRYGVRATLQHALSLVAFYAARIRWWQTFVLTPQSADWAILEGRCPVKGRTLEAVDLRPYAQGPDALFTPRFLEAAISRGDRCFAFFDGDAVISYGWYATLPTRLPDLDPTLALYFDPAYVHMYNTFTRPQYRGQRLHAIGALTMLRSYVGRGWKGLICYVDGSNITSLRACGRVGFKQFGRIMLMRLGGRYLCSSSAGCAAYQLRVESAPPRPAP